MEILIKTDWLSTAERYSGKEVQMKYLIIVKKLERNNPTALIFVYLQKDYGNIPKKRWFQNQSYT